MSDINPNIQRISFEEIQEFKDLDLFKLTWEQTNGRRVLLAYDPKSHTFGYSYAEPGTDGGDQNISIFYGYSALIANFLDSDDLSARPSINGFDDGDGIIAMSTVGSVNKFDFFDVEISEDHGIDRYVFKMSLVPTVFTQPEDGYTPVKGVDYFDGETPVKGVDYFDGYTPVKGVDYFDGAPAVTNLQKVLVYPADFTGINYVLKNSDNNHELIIDNGTTDVTLTVPTGLSSKIGIGFTQKGLGNVLYVPAAGTAVRNPTGLFIRGQFFQTYLSQEGTTNVFYLGGDTKSTAEAAPVGTPPVQVGFTAPSNLNSFSDGPGIVDLWWTASTGSFTLYEIFRDGILHTATSNAFFSDNTDDTVVREYKVRARDDSYNYSDFSNTVTRGGMAPLGSGGSGNTVMTTYWFTGMYPTGTHAPGGSLKIRDENGVEQWFQFLYIEDGCVSYYSSVPPYDLIDVEPCTP